MFSEHIFFAVCWVQLYLTLCDPVDCGRQAPLSMGFSRQEYCSGVPFPFPGDLPNQESNLHLLCLLYWQVDSLPQVPPLLHQTPKHMLRGKKEYLLLYLLLHSISFRQKFSWNVTEVQIQINMTEPLAELSTIKCPFSFQKNHLM